MRPAPGRLLHRDPFERSCGCPTAATSASTPSPPCCRCSRPSSGPSPPVTGCRRTARSPAPTPRSGSSCASRAARCAGTRPASSPMAPGDRDPTGQVSVALQTDKTPAAYATLARAAEDLGFDGVSVFADLGFQPPALALTTIAAATTRVRIGVACQNPLLDAPRRDRRTGRRPRPRFRGPRHVGGARGAWSTGSASTRAARWPGSTARDDPQAAHRRRQRLRGGRARPAGGCAPTSPARGARRPARRHVGRRTAQWAGDGRRGGQDRRQRQPHMAATMRDRPGDSPTCVVAGAVALRRRP